MHILFSSFLFFKHVCTMYSMNMQTKRNKSTIKFTCSSSSNKNNNNNCSVAQHKRINLIEKLKCKTDKSCCIYCCVSFSLWCGSRTLLNQCLVLPVFTAHWTAERAKLAERKPLSAFIRIAKVADKINIYMALGIERERERQNLLLKVLFPKRKQQKLL